MIIIRQKAFSEVEQKEFNSKAQKLLRNKHDIKVGMKKIKELTQPGGFKPELIGPETIVNAKQYGRGMNKTYRGSLKPKSINEKINKKEYFKDLQKKGLISEYEASEEIKDVMSPGLSGRILRRKYK